MKYPHKVFVSSRFAIAIQGEGPVVCDLDHIVAQIRPPKSALPDTIHYKTGVTVTDRARSITVCDETIGKIFVKDVFACELPIQPRRRLGVDTAQASAATVALTRSHRGRRCLLLSLKACQNDRLQMLRRTLSLLRRNINGLRRGAPSISTPCKQSSLMSACNEEVPGHASVAF